MTLPLDKLFLELQSVKMSFLKELNNPKLRKRGVKKQCSDKDPNTVYDDPWIYERDPKYDDTPSGGKWMLMYDRKEQKITHKKIFHALKNYTVFSFFINLLSIFF